VLLILFLLLPSVVEEEEASVASAFLTPQEAHRLQEEWGQMELLDLEEMAQNTQEELLLLLLAGILTEQEEGVGIGEEHLEGEL